MSDPDAAPESLQDLDTQPLGRLVRRQVRHEFRPPFDEVTIVLINAALLVSIWFLLNPSLVARYTSLIFLPAAIASWAFADVPATNIFGSEPARAIQVIDHPRAVVRLFTVKNLALWLLISPACVVLSMAMAPSQAEPVLSLAVAVAVLCMPFGYLGVCALVAPYLPFHRMPLKERRRRRDTWLRYGTALVIPYVLTVPAAALTALPVIIMAIFVGNSPTHMLGAALIIAPWSFFVWRYCLRWSARITERRSAWLHAYLEDPSRG